MNGWRVWLAFEAKPGITRLATCDFSDHWRGLADACQRPNGGVDAAEFDRWLDLFLGHAHLLGQA